MKCTQRLYLTADRKKLVADGDKRAATLYAVPGDEIPASAVELFRLVDGALKGFSAAKQDNADGNKEKAPGGDKEKAPGEDKAKPTQPDDLEALKGVGHKSATLLAAAGLTSYAAIAAVDPAAPPAIEGIGRLFKWPDVIADAKAKLPAPTQEAQG